MANSGRGEAAKIQPLSPEPSNASCLHCPVDLVGVLNWPTEDGEIWDGQKGREGSQPEMGLDQMLRRAFCLRSRSSPGIWIRQHKMPEPVESSPLWCSGENRQEGRNMPSSHSEQRAGQDLEPGTCGHCPTPLPPPPHLFRWGTLLGKKAVDIAPDPGEVSPGMWHFSRIGLNRRGFRGFILWGRFRPPWGSGPSFLTSTTLQ